MRQIAVCMHNATSNTEQTSRNGSKKGAYTYNKIAKEDDTSGEGSLIGV